MPEAFSAMKSPRLILRQVIIKHMKHPTILGLGREPLCTTEFSDLLNTAQTFEIQFGSSIQEMYAFPTCSSLVPKGKGEAGFPAVKDLSKTRGKWRKNATSQVRRCSRVLFPCEALLGMCFSFVSRKGNG